MAALALHLSEPLAAGAAPPKPAACGAPDGAADGKLSVQTDAENLAFALAVKELPG